MNEKMTEHYRKLWGYVGFVKMSRVFTSLSRPPALLPVKEQQSVSELADFYFYYLCSLIDIYPLVTQRQDLNFYSENLQHITHFLPCMAIVYSYYLWSVNVILAMLFTLSCPKCITGVR